MEREFIKLDQFLKLAQVVQTGGEAKRLIQSGFIMVNDEVETRRGRKLYHGDCVDGDGELMQVIMESDEE
jgi:ribosome-associated protein